MSRGDTSAWVRSSDGRIVMTCPICRNNEPTAGLLCEGCRDELCGPVQIAPEQITVQGSSAVSTAALIDVWGRPNRIGHPASIGRNIDTDGLSILHGSVSRRHATLGLEGGIWKLRELGSVNGTIVNGQLVGDVVTLRDGDHVQFGPFGFYFIEDATRFPPTRIARSSSTTIRPYDRAQTLDLHADPLPSASFVFRQPTGGGGGLVEIDGIQVQLTLAQFELLSILAERMASDEKSPLETRGFIDASMLLRCLSLDSNEPSEDSVRHLVQRVRRALAKANVRVTLESKHRLGYRLGAVPRIKRQP